MARPDSEIRDDVLAHLRKHHPDISRHWFEDIQALEISGGVLKLLVRQRVQLKYLQRNCVPQFQEAAQAVTGFLTTVRFVGEAGSHEDGWGSPAGESGAGPDSVRGSFSGSSGGSSAGYHTGNGNGHAPHDDEMVLSPDYSFANFVIGPSNKLAHAASVAVSQKPGRAYNPFFIHASVGLGKTHLLQAVCQEAMRNNPSINIRYISCNDFINQFHDCVQAGQMSGFRDRFRHVDLLLVDDIHDLSKRNPSQEEFFHTFNSLHQSGRQIVLSSDAPPSEIPDLEERLTSRFNCGLVAPIDKPCYETRLAILNSKAALRNMKLPEEVAFYIATRVDTNIRELEGAIITLQGLAQFNNAAIDLDLAKQAIGETPGHAGASPTIHAIINAITSFYDVRLIDLLSKKRHKLIALPRQVGMWLARTYTRHSLEDIGGYLGGRDHSTVLHAIRTIDLRQQSDPNLRREIACLQQMLLTSPPASEVPPVTSKTG